jgi:hypothetical protein
VLAVAADDPEDDFAEIPVHTLDFLSINGRGWGRGGVFFKGRDLDGWWLLEIS